MVNTLFVGCSAVCGTFQVDRCEINGFFSVDMILPEIIALS